MRSPVGLHPSELQALQGRQPLLWLCRRHDPRDAASDLPYDPSDAMARFERCADLLADVFAPLRESAGRLTSPLTPIPQWQRALEFAPGANAPAPGVWFLKRDDALPVAGSVKARGGFHEVLALIERLAVPAWLTQPDFDRRELARQPIRERLARHTVSVGSTGNLGLAIGLIARGLGLQAAVHMSTDAKSWKKSRLRERGIEVIEHAGDYAAAVAAGRLTARTDPLVHFVDDEHSVDLFLGYAAAAEELLQQLRAANRPVDAEHPLFVYLPCGVGGAPGGITYGLKRLLGPHVHCFFAEPVASPCMLLQLAAGAKHPISVHDIGLDNRTEADGLAVGQASPLVAPIMERLLAGVFTVVDPTLFEDARAIERLQGIYIEPSAAAALRGPVWLQSSPAGQHYLQRHGLLRSLEQSTHVIWSTGGSLVPEPVRAELRACRALSDN